MFGNLRLCEIPPTLLSYQVFWRKFSLYLLFFHVTEKKEIQILKDFFLMSCLSNLHWFSMHWHSKFFALLYQICCIFIPKLLLVGCLTFTMMEYPSQCLLDIWLSWAIWSSIWVLNFLKVLCFQTFHLNLCYISQANLT